jgi:WD40 repeat protein
MLKIVRILLWLYVLFLSILIFAGGSFTRNCDASGITSAVFTPNGNVLFARANGQAELWALNGRSPLRTYQFRDDLGRVTTLAFSPDNRLLHALSLEGERNSWDLQTFKQRKHIERTITDQRDDSNFVISPDGRLYANIRAEDRVRNLPDYVWIYGRVTIEIRNAETEDIVDSVFLGERVPETEFATVLAFSPDSHLLALTNFQNQLFFRDIQHHRSIPSQFIVPGDYQNFDFTADGKYLMGTTCTTTPAQLWDTRTGQPERTFQFPEPDGDTDNLCAYVFSPDGKRVYSTGSRGTTLTEWDMQTGKMLRGFETDLDFIQTIAISPDGFSIAIGGGGNHVEVWNLQTGQVRFDLPLPGLTDSVAFSHDGALIATAGENTVLLWRASDGTRVQRLNDSHSGALTSIAISPDGKTIATGSYDQTIRLWDATTGQPIKTLTGYYYAVTNVTFSNDGQRLLSSGFEGIAYQWDIATGQILQDYFYAPSPSRRYDSGFELMTAAAFSPDEQYVLTAGNGEWFSHTKLFDARTGAMLRQFESGNAAAFSLDGHYLVTSNDISTLPVITLWNLTSGKAVNTERYYRDEEIVSLAYSPDGRYVAIGDIWGGLMLWDTSKTEHEWRVLWGHSDAVWGTIFSADGKTLVSVSQDGQAIVWDVASGRRITTLCPPLLGDGGLLVSALLLAGLLWDVTRLLRARKRIE